MLKKINWQNEIKDWLISIVIAIVLAFLIRTFIIEPYMVEGPSMMPTLENHERLLVNKFIYTFDEPKKGEIIVFRYPRDLSRDFIKRVIATGGDTIEIRRGTLYINGDRKEESYILERPKGSYNKVIVPEGHVFVMGDNRNNSEDSRYPDVGFVPMQLVKGKAFVVFWPVDAWRLLP
jgi:signal peptidase I